MYVPPSSRVAGAAMAHAGAAHSSYELLSPGSRAQKMSAVLDLPDEVRTRFRSEPEEVVC